MALNGLSRNHHGTSYRRMQAIIIMVALLAHTSNASSSLTNLSWVLVGSLQWNHFHVVVATALRDSSSSCGKRALYRYSIQHCRLFDIIVVVNIVVVGGVGLPRQAPLLVLPNFIPVM
jgi:hypothetical protein